MRNNSILRQIKSINESDIESTIDKLVNTETSITIGFLNQYGYNLLCQSSEVKSNFFALDYLFRDGIGIKLACKLNRIESGANLNGTDFIPKIIRQINLHQKKVFCVYGTQSPWLERGAENLLCSKDFLKLDGFRDEGVYIEHFKMNQKTNALNVVILAMGMPKQESLARKLRALSSGSTIIICGGAIIDFKANRFRRAPEIFKKTGMEWLFRLLSEPKRLFKRYVFGIPKFFYYILKYRS